MSKGQTGALRWVALVVLLAGGFMPPLDFFIVNVALSSIHESLGATPAELQLVISGYACGYGVFLITGGRLGDLYGRKRCFLIGMAGFSLASLGCGLATSPDPSGDRPCRAGIGGGDPAAAGPGLDPGAVPQ